MPTGQRVVLDDESETLLPLPAGRDYPLLVVRRRLAIRCIALLASAALAACSSANETETVATIGRETITADLLAHWSRISEHAAHRSATDARAHALDYLIVSAWVRAEARRRGITVSDDEVARRLSVRGETAIGGSSGFRAALAASGETLADARAQVETDALYKRLEEAATVAPRVPSSAVRTYYGRHLRRFVIPERRFFLSDTSTNKRRVALDRDRALGGKPFPASALHETLSRSQIDYGGAPRKTIERAIFAAPVGVPIGPFQNEPVESHTIVEVTRVVPARHETLAHLRPEITRLLTAAARQRSLEQFRRTWQLRWRRSTRCRHPTAAPACAAYVSPVALTL